MKVEKSNKGASLEHNGERIDLSDAEWVAAIELVKNQIKIGNDEKRIYKAIQELGECRSRDLLRKVRGVTIAQLMSSLYDLEADGVVSIKMVKNMNGSPSVWIKHLEKS